VIVVLCLVMLMSNVAAAQPRWSPTDSFGGEGGGPFEQACPGNSYMIGLLAKAGAWINALSPVCAVWEPGGATLAELSEQPWHGSTDGGTTFIRCAPKGGVIVGIDAQPAQDHSHTVVGLINVYCGEIQKPGEHANKLGGSRDYLGNTANPGRKSLNCAPGLVASGIYGRNGAFIDKIGLYCVQPNVRPATASAPVFGQCRSGFVWRVTRAQDHVCVTPDSRRLVATENATAASHRQPGGGASGPATCQNGLVWREAYEGDSVCVTPQRRADVKQENELQLQRVAQ
jgi:hypothetical protein